MPEPGLPQRLTPEQIAKLSPAAKLDYARQFNQSAMPPNPHDQAREQKR